MSNVKISALSASTTPLTGTEVVPVVQSGTTKKVSVADLTAGRNVSVNSLGLGGTAPVSYAVIEWGPSGSVTYGAEFTPLLNADTTNVQMFRARPRSSSNTHTDITSFYAGLDGLDAGATVTTAYGFRAANPAATITNLYGYYSAISAGTGRYDAYYNGGADSYTAGNWKFAAAKGVNFTANTPASGMTSQLLNWYEEGTWTPNQGSGLTVIGAFSSTGKYTRVGRNLTISGTVTGATSVALAAAGIITTNLPFTVGTAGHGNITNAALTSFSAIICTSTNVTSAGAIAATGTLTFSATYFV